MTAGTASTQMEARSGDGLGAVTGMPRVWLRVEGVAVMAAGAGLYLHLGGSPVALVRLLLAVDISMVGYVVGPRPGALIYNLAHNWAAGVAVLAPAGGLDRRRSGWPARYSWRTRGWTVPRVTASNTRRHLPTLTSGVSDGRADSAACSAPTPGAALHPGTRSRRSDRAGFAPWLDTPSYRRMAGARQAGNLGPTTWLGR